MNAENLGLASGLVDSSYLTQGSEELRRRETLVRVLLSQRRLPDEGWPEAAIEGFVRELAAMDSNNFSTGVGAGEREARVWSPLVRSRHWGLAHGVGRSGDVASTQPKAAGSSLLAALTHGLALSAAHECGLKHTAAALVLPLATGMSIAAVLRVLKSRRPASRFVIWSRIDQRSCFKAIGAAGAEPIVVSQKVREGGDELRTDIEGIRAAIVAAGPDAVVAVMTTTSCFAPRAPDCVREVARLCAEMGVPHVVNHAYGLMSARLCGVLDEASVGWPVAKPRRGETETNATPAVVPTSRVDAWISSTDKNFMVPVGGAIVGSNDPAFIDAVACAYPGRASASPAVDLFVTLLGMGVKGLRALLVERALAFDALGAALARVAQAHGGGARILSSPHNPISIGLFIGRSDRNPTYAGALLFSRGVSGMRVVAPKEGAVASVDGHDFVGWGASVNVYAGAPYLTAAAGMGFTRADVTVVESRLSKALAEWTRQGDKAAVTVL